MKRLRLLPALFAGVLFYVILSVIAGRDGLWVRNQLREQKRVLSSHAADIEKTHGELVLEKTALEKDPDVIRAYARKLGYVNSDEKLVKIIGLPVRENRVYDAGTVMKHSGAEYLNEGVCKLLGLIIGFLVYAVLFLADFSRGYITFPAKTKKVRLSEGTVVYDLQ
ncbi:MAG: septum formation initiator family protein [Treponema sp.]|nr:septum formation initiator family protein [Treponema sp.]